MGYSDVSPGVGMRHLEGPKNPDEQNLGIYVFVYVYKVHMCIHILGGRMRQTDCFFYKICFLFTKKSKRNTETSSAHGFELHKPSIKGIKLLFKVTNGIIIINLHR